MTHDDIIRLAREACDKDKVDPYQNDFWAITQEELERFAALVAAAEREACAKACEWEAAKLEQWPQRDVLTVRACAAAIRARGET
jgi:hypothetical protein